MIRRQVFQTVGYLLFFLGLSMGISAGWSVYYGEGDFYSLLNSMLITSGIGGLMYFLFRSKDESDLSTRDGFAIVTIGWLLMAVFCALPFYLSGSLNFTNSFFESMSGLTTTGASILGHSSTLRIEDLPHGVLFWRSFTHFIGGMGIIVFSIALLPMLGIGGVQLFRAEVAGPTKDKLTPRVKQTAKLLWGIYVGFVLLETLILRIEGLPWFDALCHSFGTMATGGFSTNSDSIAVYGGVVQWTIMFFMFCAATNFSLHYFFISKGKADYLKDREFILYLCLFIIFGLLFYVNISGSSNYRWSFESFTHAMFTSISLLTTTGFGTENFKEWPALSQTLVFFLLFIGGSAGSTTGGMKIIRTILVSKYLITEVRKLLHPKGIFTITIGDETIDDEIIKTTLGFYLFYIFIFVITAIVFSMTGLDMTTSLTASASAIGNIGPGLGSIGPAENWGHFTDLAKWLACFSMLLGRLEIFTVMVLFSRSFWKK